MSIILGGGIYRDLKSKPSFACTEPSALRMVKPAQFELEIIMGNSLDCAKNQKKNVEM